MKITILDFVAGIPFQYTLSEEHTDRYGCEIVEELGHDSSLCEWMFHDN